MALGLLTFSGCIGYIAYMKQQYKNAKVVTALNDQDEIVLVKKKSQWDWTLQNKSQQTDAVIQYWLNVCE